MADKIVGKFTMEPLNPKLRSHIVKVNDEPYINHFLCFFSEVDLGHESIANAIVNYNFKINSRQYKAELKKKNYGEALVWIEKKFKLVWFIKNYKKIYTYVGDEEYYSILGSLLTDVDFHFKTKKHYSRLLSFGINPLHMMDSRERKLFDKLPDTFTVYRGVSTNNEVTPALIKNMVGNSWTRDKKKALWFFTHKRNGKIDKNRILYSYEISKSEVIAYFTGRNEKEIFVDYKKLDQSKINIKHIKQ